jgi:hypothetical protein
VAVHRAAHTVGGGFTRPLHRTTCELRRRSMRRVGVRLLADRSEVVNARLCRQPADDGPSIRAVRVGGQDLHLGCSFPSGRVDRRLRSLPSDVNKIVSSTGRFLMWLCRRRFCSVLAESCMQTTTERPMFFSVACFVAVVRLSFRFANFDEPGAHS